MNQVSCDDVAYFESIIRLMNEINDNLSKLTSKTSSEESVNVKNRVENLRKVLNIDNNSSRIDLKASRTNAKPL